MDDLALEVAQFHSVIVDQTDSSHASGSQVERGWRTQSAGPDNEHTGLVEPSLTLHTNVWKAEVPGVASNINHGVATRLPHIKETASVDVLFQPLFNVHSG